MLIFEIREIREQPTANVLASLELMHMEKSKFSTFYSSGTEVGSIWFQTMGKYICELDKPNWQNSNHWVWFNIFLNNVYKYLTSTLNVHSAFNLTLIKWLLF